MSGSTQSGVFVNRRKNNKNCNIKLMDDGDGLTGHRVVRAGKTQDAVRARRVIRIARRQVRSALAVVQAKLDRRRALIGVSGEGETTDRKEETLRRHRIGDEHAD
jgi:hypothetical protein